MEFKKNLNFKKKLDQIQVLIAHTRSDFSKSDWIQAIKSLNFTNFEDKKFHPDFLN